MLILAGAVVTGAWFTSRPASRSGAVRSISAADESDEGRFTEDLDTSPTTGLPGGLGLRPPVRSTTGGVPAPRRGWNPDPRDEDVQLPQDRPSVLTPKTSVLSETTVDDVTDLWSRRDIDGLAAVADRSSHVSFAGYVLAAGAAHEVGDARYSALVQGAFESGLEPADDPVLSPLLGELKFPVIADDLALDLYLPCSRVGLGLSLACTERLIGDPETAYMVLLELPETPLVCLLRAQVALDLKWSGRALRSLTSSVEDETVPADVWQPAWYVVEGIARAGEGQQSESLVKLDAGIQLLEQDPKESSTLLQRALFERAFVREGLGDDDGSWADLTQVLTLNPQHEQARAALKSL